MPGSIKKTLQQLVLTTLRRQDTPRVFPAESLMVQPTRTAREARSEGIYYLTQNYSSAIFCRAVVSNKVVFAGHESAILSTWVST